MSWHTQMQIAIVEKDSEKIATLVGQDLNFETLEQMQEAQYLLAEAALVVKELRDTTEKTMKQLKKNIDFLKVTEDKKVNRLDIRS